MWHVCLEGLKDVGSLCYGWRAEADVAWEGRTRFHPGNFVHSLVSCAEGFCTDALQQTTFPNHVLYHALILSGLTSLGSSPYPILPQPSASRSVHDNHCAAKFLCDYC